jgi:hypothetical protein
MPISAQRYRHFRTPVRATPVERQERLAWPLLIILLLLLLGNNLFSKITLLVCVAYAGIANLPKIPSILAALKHNPWLLLLQLWGACSIAWSAVPAVTQDIVIVQGTFFLLAILIAADSIDKNIDRSLKVAAFLVIGVIVVFALLYPGAAISAQGFKAIYGNKNGLGLVMAVCLLILLCSGKPAWPDYVAGTVALAFLCLSRSKTSISLFVSIYTLFLASALFHRWRARRSEFTLGVLRLAASGAIGMLYGAIIAMVLFRESLARLLAAALPYDFLTGRGELWVIVLNRTDPSLLQGIGPGSFWGAGRLSEIAQTALFTQHPFWIERLGSADGGYIDLIGAMGFTGLGLLLASFVRNWQILRQLGAVPVTDIATALIGLFIFHNVTETTIYHSTNFLWFIYMYFSYYLIFLRDRTCHVDHR